MRNRQMHDLRVAIPLILRYLRGPRAEDHHGRLGLELEEHAEELVEVGLVDDVADPSASASVSEGWPRSTTMTRTRIGKGIWGRYQDIKHFRVLENGVRESKRREFAVREEGRAERANEQKANKRRASAEVCSPGTTRSLQSGRRTRSGDRNRT
jgi:hypothetical protein